MKRTSLLLRTPVALLSGLMLASFMTACDAGPDMMDNEASPSEASPAQNTAKTEVQSQDASANSASAEAKTSEATQNQAKPETRAGRCAAIMDGCSDSHQVCINVGKAAQICGSAIESCMDGAQHFCDSGIKVIESAIDGCPVAKKLKSCFHTFGQCLISGGNLLKCKAALAQCITGTGDMCPDKKKPKKPKNPKKPKDPQDPKDPNDCDGKKKKPGCDGDKGKGGEQDPGCDKGGKCPDKGGKKDDDGPGSGTGDQTPGGKKGDKGKGKDKWGKCPGSGSDKGGCDWGKWGKGGKWGWGKCPGTGGCEWGKWGKGGKWGWGKCPGTGGCDWGKWGKGSKWGKCPGSGAGKGGCEWGKGWSDWGTGKGKGGCEGGVCPDTGGCVDLDKWVDDIHAKLPGCHIVGGLVKWKLGILKGLGKGIGGCKTGCPAGKMKLPKLGTCWDVMGWLNTCKLVGGCGCGGY